MAVKLYAETKGRRARQLLGDATLVLWTLLWVWIGLATQDLVVRLSGPARATARAGRDLSERLADAGRAAGEIPLVGGALRAPLEQAGRAGDALRRAGESQATEIEQLALWLGVAFAAVPIAAALLHHLPRRVAWMREAGAAARLRESTGDLRLFALRAIATRPLAEIRGASGDPVAALLSGDCEALATLELRALGLRAAHTGVGHPRPGRD